jgi:hypothetical protein
VVNRQLQQRLQNRLQPKISGLAFVTVRTNLVAVGAETRLRGRSDAPPVPAQRADRPGNRLALALRAQRPIGHRGAAQAYRLMGRTGLARVPTGKPAGRLQSGQFLLERVAERAVEWGRPAAVAAPRLLAGHLQDLADNVTQLDQESGIDEGAQGGGPVQGFGEPPVNIG